MKLERRGSSEVLEVAIGVRGMLRIALAAAGGVGSLVAVLAFLGLTPADVRAAEARILRVEIALAQVVEANAETAGLLAEHLKDERIGYERLSALEEHARSIERWRDRLSRTVRPQKGEIGPEIVPPGEDDPE
jgi:hypothetical protein